MRLERLWRGILLFAGMLILILDSKTALNGAVQGIDLCIRTVIPSLFPFFVLSILLTGALMGTQTAVLKVFGKLFHIPAGAESLLLSAFLGGYPAGAHNIAAACQSGNMEIKDGKRLLCYCNNAGPAFLFGMLLPMFPDPEQVWLLWGITILSAFLYAQLTEHPAASAVQAKTDSKTASDAMWSAIRSMAMVCGWVVLFRVILAFLNRWILWILNPEWQIFVTGLLELANGCSSLYQTEDIQLRFVISAFILSFGGICVTMQTMSVFGSLFHCGYIKAKLIQSLFSLILSVLIVKGYRLAFFLFPAAILIFSRIRQKNVAISRPVMYNTHTY